MLHHIIIINQFKVANQTIRGLRYPVEMILQLMSSGMSMEEILEDYEDLEKDDIMAALFYASKIDRGEVHLQA